MDASTSKQRPTRRAILGIQYTDEPDDSEHGVSSQSKVVALPLDQLHALAEFDYRLALVCALAKGFPPSMLKHIRRITLLSDDITGKHREQGQEDAAPEGSTGSDSSIVADRLFSHRARCAETSASIRTFEMVGIDEEQPPWVQEKITRLERQGKELVRDLVLLYSTQPHGSPLREDSEKARAELLGFRLLMILRDHYEVLSSFTPLPTRLIRAVTQTYLAFIQCRYLTLRPATRFGSTDVGVFTDMAFSLAPGDGIQLPQIDMVGFDLVGSEAPHKRAQIKAQLMGHDITSMEHEKIEDEIRDAWLRRVNLWSGSIGQGRGDNSLALLLGPATFLNHACPGVATATCDEVYKDVDHAISRISMRPFVRQNRNAYEGLMESGLIKAGSEILWTYRKNFFQVGEWYESINSPYWSACHRTGVQHV